MIKKIKGQYVVISETTGRVFGRYMNKKDAHKRLQQMEMFKHFKQRSKKRSP
ncbi:MAG: hypothetical protein HY445_00890 [Candidatus Niyogibacteria bacterium]|nr:hypothetical protein [Candidatus Niyogibacteria bacterium]